MNRKLSTISVLLLIAGLITFVGFMTIQTAKETVRIMENGTVLERMSNGRLE